MRDQSKAGMTTFSQNGHSSEAERVLQNYVDSAPIIEELRALGYEVDSIQQMYKLGRQYGDAVPILTEWLVKTRNLDVKQALVRALSVPWALKAAPALASEYASAPDHAVSGLKWAIGNALSIVATDDVFQDVARLASDRQHGRGREMLPLALARMKKNRREAETLLMQLLADEEVAGHAVIALGKLRSEQARQLIEPFLSHSKSWIRREARKAIEKISRPRSESKLS